MHPSRSVQCIIVEGVNERSINNRFLHIINNHQVFSKNFVSDENTDDKSMILVIQNIP